MQARIPAGVSDGQTIRLKGRGAPGRNGGPAGDLWSRCHAVKPHRTFGRSGNNLTVTVPITFAEAALGGDIDVPTLDGTTVKLRLRPGTPVGFAPPGQGQGHGRPPQGRHGDLIVTVEVHVPTDSATRSVRPSNSLQQRLR